MRRDLDAATVLEEELLLRWLLNKEDIAAMRAAGPAKDYVTTRILVKCWMHRRHAGLQPRSR